jgi:hypothetical protein
MSTDAIVGAELIEQRETGSRRPRQPGALTNDITGVSD